MKTNILLFISRTTEGSLFLKAFYINYICNFNIQNTQNINLNQFTIYTIKDIKREEITISYFNSSKLNKYLTTSKHFYN